MEEVWKPVPSKPGLQASNLGRVRLPARSYVMPNGGVRVTKPKPTRGYKVSKNPSRGYHMYQIYNPHFGNIKVHRAVCEAFHGPPPTPKHVAMHIDEDGLNNHEGNLCWGTRKENQNAPGFKAFAAAVCRDKMAGKSGMRKART